MEGQFVEERIKRDKSFPLGNLQNVYFKNFGEKNVMIGQFELRPDQETYIHTGNTTLAPKDLNIMFTDGIGTTKDLYVRYIKVPDCTCD
ncbi:hypothetical protein [Tenacibaculum aiptasiae]|uniref:hypothetical protein n=1 Tax=Tenacibaculum aiptasiae TaxID=426481 RepID=UPI00232D2533|nr:hypothetical protein [Tenacibaculum aiptasiae]